MLNSNWYFFTRSAASFDRVTSLLTSSYSEVSLHFSITLLLDFVWARGDNMASHKNVSHMLSKTFEFSFKGWQSVIYDKISRCHLCYFQDEGLAQYSEVARPWTPWKQQELNKGSSGHFGGRNRPGHHRSIVDQAGRRRGRRHIGMDWGPDIHSVWWGAPPIWYRLNHHPWNRAPNGLPNPTQGMQEPPLCCVGMLNTDFDSKICLCKESYSTTERTCRHIW